MSFNLGLAPEANLFKPLSLLLRWEPGTACLASPKTKTKSLGSLCASNRAERKSARVLRPGAARLGPSDRDRALPDAGHPMAEESTMSDLVDVTRRPFDALNCRDLD
jgi:hypothetical protein